MTDTPIHEYNRKRFLSSPEFAEELKKQCLNTSLSSNNTSAELTVLHQSYLSKMSVNPRIPVTEHEHEPPITEHITAPQNRIILSQADYRGIASALESAFEHKLTSMVNTITDGVLKGINEKLDSLQSENLALKEENNRLRNEVADLKKAQDASEQYSRRNNVRITGMPESQGESTDNLVMKLADAIEANINIEEIDRSHRVGKPTAGKSRDIIVKMTTYRSRQKLMTNRKKAKDSGYENVFINEDLTRFRSNVHYRAREMVKAGKLEGAWTSDGTILVKDRLARIHRVTCADDLTPFTI